MKRLHASGVRGRDLAWLALTSMVGFAGGLVVVTAAGLAGSYVSMPVWYWAVTDPHTQYGLTRVGQFTVDTMGDGPDHDGKALLH